MANVRIRDLKAKIEKADKGQYYISLSRKDGKFKSSHVKVSGAEKMFEKDPEYIYVRPLRHAGNREDLQAFLIGAGFDATQVNTYLQDSYSASNFEKMQKEYLKEVSKLPSSAPRARIQRAAVTMDQIISIGKKLEDFKVETKSARSPVPCSPRASAGGKADLKSRLAALTEDKVLDITQFDPTRKVGFKSIPRPVRGMKKSVGNTVDLKRIVYDFSNPVENGIAALVFLGFSEEKATKVMRDPNHTKPVDLSTIAIKH